MDLNTLRKSEEEVQSGYTYVPIDPFAVAVYPDYGCPTEIVDTAYGPQPRPLPNPPYVPLWQSLPDNSVRMLIETYDANGNVTYGASKVTAATGFYRATFDYINADTYSFKVAIKRTLIDKTTGKLVPVELNQPIDTHVFIANSDQYEVISMRYHEKDSPPSGFKVYTLPVYIGIGLRITANVTTTSGNTNINGIGLIGTEAELGHLRGSLTVQTLGINGKAVAAALPIQSEVNRTTAQNAIVSVGAIKALLYANEETSLAPRAVGLYLPFNGGTALVNAIISAMAADGPLDYRRQCDPVKVVALEKEKAVAMAVAAKPPKPAAKGAKPAAKPAKLADAPKPTIQPPPSTTTPPAPQPQQRTSQDQRVGEPATAAVQ